MEFFRPLSLRCWFIVWVLESGGVVGGGRKEGMRRTASDIVLPIIPINIHSPFGCVTFLIEFPANVSISSPVASNCTWQWMWTRDQKKRRHSLFACNEEIWRTLLPNHPPPVQICFHELPGSKESIFWGMSTSKDVILQPASQWNVMPENYHNLSDLPNLLQQEKNIRGPEEEEEEEDWNEVGHSNCWWKFEAGLSMATDRQTDNRAPGGFFPFAP